MFGPAGRDERRRVGRLAVAQASIGMPSDRQFLGLIGKLLPGWFPHLPCQSQYNRRLRRLAPRWRRCSCGSSELLACERAAARGRHLDRRRQLRGLVRAQRVRRHGAYGYCAAKSQYVWGVRLVLITDDGVPVGYTSSREREGVRAGA